MLPVFTARQSSAADALTIQRQGISSSQLMERAALKCVQWLLLNESGWNKSRASLEYVALCGPGNNGGDGLAMARLLAGCGRRVVVYRADSARYSADNSLNYSRLPGSVRIIAEGDVAGLLQRDAVIVIDALFGSGLSRPLDDRWRGFVQALNACKCAIVSIDAPSGISVDGTLWPGAIAVEADVTLGLGSHKPAYLFREFEPFVGRWIVLPIGLELDSFYNVNDCYYITEKQDIIHCIPGYRRHAHKGDHGHAGIIAGAPGMFGAAVLATRAALRSGAGLVTAFVPEEARAVLHASTPEAMVTRQWEVGRSMYTAMGIGPGLGVHCADELRTFLPDHQGPLVLDADALNMLAVDPAWANIVRTGTILTPHPKEFDRLFGPHLSSLERVQRAAREAFERGWVIVLKGAYTAVCSPNGAVHFNPTGDPGMAKGGSGDVLTGLLTGLLARGLKPFDAARTGVWLHGLAGGLAAERVGRDGMTASDIVESLPAAWRELRGRTLE